MTTEILGLDEMTQSQGSKYLTLNTITRQLEARLVRVLSRTTTAQPGSPAEGDTYIVPASATGADWAGQDGKIAHYYSSVWHFYTAFEGLRFWVNDENRIVVHDGSSFGALTAAGVLALPVLAKTADYTVVAGDAGKLIAVTDTTAARTITLPAAATAGDGFVLGVHLEDATNPVTIDANGAETIDGAATRDLVTGGDSVLLVCDGTKWRTVASEITSTGAGSGDVTGPASATDNALARFDGTTGKSIQNSAWTLGDAGVLNAADAVLQRPELKDYAETRTAPTSTAGALTLDLVNGNVFEVTLTEATTFTFSNPPASGKAGTITLVLKQDATGGRTVTWPGSVQWAGGTAPTLTTTASAVDVLTFITVDAGTNWYGFLAGAAMA